MTTPRCGAWDNVGRPTAPDRVTRIVPSSTKHSEAVAICSIARNLRGMGRTSKTCSRSQEGLTELRRNENARKAAWLLHASNIPVPHPA